MNKNTIILGAMLLFALSLGSYTVLQLQGYTSSIFSPLWKKWGWSSNQTESFQQTIELMQTHLLQVEQERDTLEKLYLQQQALILNQPANRESLNLWLSQTKAIPARVIYRTPTHWNENLWIDVGEQHNSPGKPVVAKNSPVVIGKSLVGLIEEVRDKQSRVRLITDSGLTPSVRAARLINEETWYLAKGELQGSNSAKWRRRGTTLKGVGFNYDFADGKGPARDLRSGQPIGEDGPWVPILRVNDLLITTGMDGVFPPGLEVARVNTIEMLGEGDYTYSIEATPTAKNIDDLSVVFVMPPYHY